MLKAVFVVLHLIVSDAGTGLPLMADDRKFDGFEISGNRIEDCRSWGVEYAHEATAFFRETGQLEWDHRAGELVLRKYPNAFTNVDCEWVRVPAAPGEPL